MMTGASRPNRASPSATRDSRLVYVVDDEQMIGEVVELILRLEDFTSKVFSDPIAAYEAFAAAEVKPALLLTDYTMGPINGLQLIERCKKIDPKLPTILYSGNIREEILQSHPVKPDGFLSKPFLPKSLTELVHKTLAGRPA